MEKLFVPYELSVKLKELGFDEPCLANYVNGTYGFEKIVNTLEIWNDEDVEILHSKIKAPLWQQAFDWFRNKYSIDSAILPTHSTKYIYRLYEQQSKSKTQIYGEYMGREYKTYEEARQACLEKLIKLIENETK